MDEVLGILNAADRLASAAMWLVVHITYSNKVDFGGRANHHVRISVVAKRSLKQQGNG